MPTRDSRRTPPSQSSSGRTRVVVFGGSGGGAVVAQSIRDINESSGALGLFGFLNDVLPVDHMISGAPVIGDFSAWSELPQDIRFIAPLHKVREMQQRAQRIQGLGIPRDRWVTVVDPKASVAIDVSPAHGTAICAQAVIMPASQIGAHVAVRPGAVVSHDTVVEDYVYVGANAVLCGYVRVHQGAHIAPGALIREYVRVGRFAVIGLGAVVLDDIPDFAIAAGNPARIVGQVRTG